MPAPQIPPETTPTALMTQAAHEAFCIWQSGCEIWTDYLAALTRSATPEGLFEANTRLLTNSLELYGRATSAVLRDGGVKAPTLNDA